MATLPLPFLVDELANLAANKRLRTPGTREERRVYFASNDYLGAAARSVESSRPAPTDSDGQALSLAMVAELAVGAQASRLVLGDDESHVRLEAEICRWLMAEACLTFTSGYAANVGALSALLGPNDVVVSDSENHASLIDGIRLSRAKVVRFQHLSLAALEEALAEAKRLIAASVSTLEPRKQRGVSGEGGGDTVSLGATFSPPVASVAGYVTGSPTNAPRVWVVTESYYSMDGDGPDLVGVADLCEQYQAFLYVDEAHALGTFGPEGRGRCAEAGVRPHVLMAAFGKSLAGQGGVIVGTRELRAYLWNRARSFMYSTGLHPALAVAATNAIVFARSGEGEAARARLRTASQRLQRALHDVIEGSSTVPHLHASLSSQSRPRKDGVCEHGFGPRELLGPIVPWVLGEEATVLRVAEWFHWQGMPLYPIRPPTVPAGKSRFRFSLTGASDQTSLTRLCELLRDSTLHALLRARDSHEDAAVESTNVDIQAATSNVRLEPGHRAGVPSETRGQLFLMVGTGTEVGKTHISEACLYAMRDRKPIPWKVVETGLASLQAMQLDSDQARLERAAGRALPAGSYRLEYPEPVSPHLEARRTGIKFDLSRADETLRQLLADGSPVLAEFPGGLFSPLAEQQNDVSGGPVRDLGLEQVRVAGARVEMAGPLDPLLTVHLVARWLEVARREGARAHCLLVAPNRLGCLHDVLATLAGAQQVHVFPDAVILSSVATTDASQASNAVELRRMVGARSNPRAVVALPRGSSETLAGYDMLRKLLASLE
jgi:8-amino-7-oxononanoate synthase